MKEEKKGECKRRWEGGNRKESAGAKKGGKEEKMERRK